MADLSITAGNVVPGSGAIRRRGVAGEAIDAGEMLYLDPADGTYKLADCDSATVAARSPAGIAVNSAGVGQPLTLVESGDVTLGSVLTAGTAYYLSGTAGGIAPVADLLTGDYPVIVGIARSASVLRIGLLEAGVALG
jgi:hypothetical protein